MENSLVIKENNYTLKVLDNYNYVVYHQSANKLVGKNVEPNSNLTYHNTLERALKKMYFKLTKKTTEFIDYKDISPIEGTKDIQRKVRMCLTNSLKNKNVIHKPTQEEILELF